MFINMKAFNKLCVLALACLAFVACDKHDKLDDLVFVGKMAPTVYWSVASTTVSAGDSVGFDAQYYTTGEAPVSHCEVWYNVMEVEAKEVTSAALPSISYTVTSTIETERRISTRIYDYAHNEGWLEDFGVNSMGDTTYFQPTYHFSAKFPTSTTLSPIQWSDLGWDSTLVDMYYGKGFMQSFKDSVEVLLKGSYGFGKEVAKGYNKVLANKHWADYKSIYVAKGGDERVYRTQYTDSMIDPQTTLYVYFFKDSILPDAVDSAFLNMEFGDLIYDGNAYKISYKRSYKLDAQLHCVDEEGTAGLSLPVTIELN